MGGGCLGPCSAASCPPHHLTVQQDVKKAKCLLPHTDRATFPRDFSSITVTSSIILVFYFVTISFRVCKFVVQTVQKSKEGHAVKLFSEAFQNYESYPIIRVLKFIKCLFLVEDLAIFMWLMTYVGAVPMELPFCSLPNCKFSALQCKVQVPIDDYIVLWGWDQVNYWRTQAKLSGIPKKKSRISTWKSKIQQLLNHHWRVVTLCLYHEEMPSVYFQTFQIWCFLTFFLFIFSTKFQNVLDWKTIDTFKTKRMRKGSN